MNVERGRLTGFGRRSVACRERSQSWSCEEDRCERLALAWDMSPVDPIQEDQCGPTPYHPSRTGTRLVGKHAGRQAGDELGYSGLMARLEHRVVDQ